MPRIPQLRQARLTVLAVLIATVTAPTAALATTSTTASTSAPSTDAATATTVHPLRWALDLSLADITRYDEARLELAGEWLDNWAMLGDRAPFAGDTYAYLAAHRKAKEIFTHLHQRNPSEPDYLGSIAATNYNIGELTPPEHKDERRRLYEEMIQLAGACVTKLDPKNARCWMLLGAGYGRLGTTRGVLKSAALADDVEDAWLKALELPQPPADMFHDPISVDTMYGLASFYRIVPDHWLVKLLTGTRGDKAKSVAYMRKAVALQPDRLELRKELAVSLLCYGEDNDDTAALAEAREILEAIVAGAFDLNDLRATDAIDKAHARELMAGPPERACGYSRDGFQDLSKEALKRAEQELKAKDN